MSWIPTLLRAAWELIYKRREEKRSLEKKYVAINRSLKNELLSHRLDMHLISLRELFHQNPSLYDIRGWPEFYYKWIQPRAETLSVIAHVATIEGGTGADADYWTLQLRSAMLADLEKIRM